MKKRLLAMVLAMTMIVGTLSTGCSSAKNEGSKGEGGKKTITIWAWDPNFNIAIMEKAKAEYQKSNPDVEINVVDFGKSDLEQKLHTLLASGTKDNLPEIVLMEDYNAQKFLQSYPGAFEDLTEKIPYENFVDSKKGFMEVDDKLYGVPFDSGVAGYYYREDILKEAGFTSEDLNNITWDRFIEIGKTIKEKTGKTMFAMDPSDLAPLRIMLNSAGTWLCDEKGEPYFANNAALKESIQHLKTMLDEGIISLHSGWADLVKGFNSGEVAGIISGVWITPSVKQEASQSGLWKIAPVPRLSVEGAVNASNLGGSSWYVLENSAGKDEAVKFLKDTYTNNEFYNSILDELGAVTTYVPSMEGEVWNREDEFFGGQAIYADMSKWMQEVPQINAGMYTYESLAVLSAGFNDILNGKSIDEVLKSVEEQVKNQIK